MYSEICKYNDCVSFQKSFYYIINGDSCRNYLFYSLTRRGKITGQIKDSSGNPLPYINIRIDDSTRSTVSDEDDNFELNNLAFQEFELIISGIGYHTQHLDINLKSGEEKALFITLLGNTLEIEGMIVRGKTQSSIKREEAFNLSSINNIEEKIF